MENTAIQEAIEKLQIEMQKATEQESPNIASGFHHSITILKKFLPKEREAIEGAYKEGWNFGYKHISKPATQYFTTKYKQDE